MLKLIASLSLDLDNKWSYLKTHGDPGWESYPSYLDVVVPRFLDIVDDLGLQMTVFVVGQDAVLPKNRSALESIAAAGHEIGNHSFQHEPWLHLYSNEELDTELASAEDAIEDATGVRTKGFRGPGFSFSPAVLATLVRRGYQYDASTLPTFLGPLARTYYFLSTHLNQKQKAERKQLFGSWKEGLRPVQPYWWKLDPSVDDEAPVDQSLLEIPVTTMPLFRVPIHVSYLLYLRQFSRVAAWAYWRLAMSLCRWTGVGPSLLLHPLDFLGGNDDPDLAFFPAMRMRSKEKTAFVRDLLDDYSQRFQVVPICEHATAIAKRNDLPIHRIAVEPESSTTILVTEAMQR